MLFGNFLKKNAEAGQAFFKKLLLVLNILNVDINCKGLILLPFTQYNNVIHIFIK